MTVDVFDEGNSKIELDRRETHYLIDALELLLSYNRHECAKGHLTYDSPRNRFVKRLTEDLARRPVLKLK
jgi:hypothetical protein